MVVNKQATPAPSICLVWLQRAQVCAVIADMLNDAAGLPAGGVAAGPMLPEQQRLLMSREKMNLTSVQQTDDVYMAVWLKVYRMAADCVCRFVQEHRTYRKPSCKPFLTWRLHLSAMTGEHKTANAQFCKAYYNQSTHVCMPTQTVMSNCTGQMYWRGLQS